MGLSGAEWWLVFLVLNAKFILATARRMLYPFVPQLSEATGKSEESVAGVIALMQLCYTLTPLLVPWIIKQLPAMKVMVLAAAIQTVCLLGVALSNTFWLFATLIFFLGCVLDQRRMLSSAYCSLGKGLLDPAALLLVSKGFAEGARERVSSVIECSWGLSSLVGIPLAGRHLSEQLKTRHLMWRPQV